MANVTATDKFRDDPRFDTAGVILGVDGDLVRMKMIRLWSWQTEHYTDDAPTYVVDRVTIVGMFKLTGAPDALVDVGLAEPRDGGFYIKGTEGEIEWLWNIRKAGQKGGKASAARAKSAGRVGGRFVASTKQPPSDDQARTKRRPSDDQANVQADTSIRDPGSGIRSSSLRSEEEREAPAAPAFSLSPPSPPADPKPDPAADLATHATAEINRATGRNFDPASKATVKLARALLRERFTAADVTLVVEHKAAEWLGTSIAARVCPATLLAADNFAKYLDEARAGPPKRAGPNGTAHAFSSIDATAEALRARGFLP